MKINYFDIDLEFESLLNKVGRGSPSKKKYKERRRKGAPLIMTRSS